jgi:hypothetical protein
MSLGNVITVVVAAGGLVGVYVTNASSLAVVQQRVGAVEQAQDKLEKLTETGRVERNAQVADLSRKIDALGDKFTALIERVIVEKRGR